MLVTATVENVATGGGAAADDDDATAGADAAADAADDDEDDDVDFCREENVAVEVCGIGGMFVDVEVLGGFGRGCGVGLVVEGEEECSVDDNMSESSFCCCIVREL